MTPRRLTLACFVLLPLLASGAFAQQPPGAKPPASTAAPAKANEVFSSAELDQMIAPIALYPDSLVAQILMASTYPGDVADAAKWSKAHPDAKGDAAVKQVANEPWDPSVQSLVAVPQVLASLSQDAGWVQRLGDAFLAEPDRVMASVQRLRAQAQSAGNLESNQYQKVSEQPGTGATPQTIIVESTSDTVYVPNYNPNYVYGSYGWGGYPPYYYPPPAYYYPGAILGTGIAFGIGIAVGGAFWGDCNWGSGDININSSRYNEFNRNVNRGDRGQIGEGGRWQHDSARRDGTPYRDQASRDKYGKQLDGAGQRTGMRGDDPARAQQRDNARQSMDRSGMGQPARSNAEAQNRGREMARNNPSGFDSRGQPPGYNQRGQNNMGARDSARASNPNMGSGRNDAFSGSRNPSSSRAASQRGQSSNMSRGASRGGGGRSMSRPPMRGGGGGRRR